MTTPPPSAGDDLQTLTLQAFTALAQLDQNWPGKIILNLGLNPQGQAISLAANIAGAVCLSLEPDPSLARAALRAGACDFLVNTLDEALRSLKNEVRKHQPLSVALTGDAAVHLAELTERGLQPNLCTSTTSAPAPSMHSSPTADLFDPAQLAAFLTPRSWSINTFTAPTAAALKAIDKRALGLISLHDSVRPRWVLTAPRLFPRDRRRVLYATAPEAAQLTAS